MNYTEKDKNDVIKMLVDMTNDIAPPSGNDTLVERLYRLIDLPCEMCNDGEVVREQQKKIDRLTVLLGNAIVLIEDAHNEKVMGTDLEDELGITQEEYSEITGNVD